MRSPLSPLGAFWVFLAGISFGAVITGLIFNYMR